MVLMATGRSQWEWEETGTGTDRSGQPWDGLGGDWDWNLGEWPGMAGDGGQPWDGLGSRPGWGSRGAEERGIHGNSGEGLRKEGNNAK